MCHAFPIPSLTSPPFHFHGALRHSLTIPDPCSRVNQSKSILTPLGLNWFLRILKLRNYTHTHLIWWHFTNIMLLFYKLKVCGNRASDLWAPFSNSICSLSVPASRTDPGLCKCTLCWYYLTMHFSEHILVIKQCMAIYPHVCVPISLGKVLWIIPHCWLSELITSRPHSGGNQTSLGSFRQPHQLL